MRRLLLAWGLVVAVGGVMHKGGSCGRDAIPDKIKIDTYGTPVISCDSPPCIGKGSANNLRAQCDSDFSETVCDGESQWTAGLIETTNGTHVTLRTLCCAFESLAEAKELQTILLYANDSYEGGDVERHGRLTGFDVIKEVRKSVDSEGNVQYIVSVYRMPCVDSELSSRPRIPFVGGHRRHRYDSYEDGDEDYVYGSKPRKLTSKDLLKRKVSLFPENGVAPDPTYSQDLGVQQSFVEASQQVSGPMPPPAAPESYSNGVVTQEQANVIQPSISSGPIPPAAIDNSYSSAGASYSGSSAYAQSVNSYAQLPTPNYATQIVAPQPVPEPAAAPAYYAPAAAPAYSGYSGAYSYPTYYAPGLKCFSGTMSVLTPSGHKMIKDLVVGDFVLSIDQNMIQFSPVIMFLHKMDNVTAEFHRITLDSGNVIELTDDHLIYEADCAEADASLRLVHAKNLKVDSCLVYAGETGRALEKTRIRRIELTPGEGIYAPLTATGDLFVNEVLASCHTNYAAKALQQTVFSIYRHCRQLYEYLWAVPQRAQFDMPFGTEYIVSVLDLFVPKSLF